MMPFAKQAAIKVYGVGIGINTIYSIYEQNKKVQRKQAIHSSDIDHTDYAMHSIMGFGIGLYTGFLWPITAIGQCSLAIDKILTVSKNN